MKTGEAEGLGEKVAEAWHSRGEWQRPTLRAPRSGKGGEGCPETAPGHVGWQLNLWGGEYLFIVSWSYSVFLEKDF